MQPLPLLRTVTAATFRTLFFAPQTPCRFPPNCFSSLPAIQSWFTPSTLNAPFFHAHLTPPQLSTLVTVESTTQTTFERVTIPFSLLLHYLSHPSPPPALPCLYLAQTPLLDTLPPLRASLPTPNLVTETGRGDVYATNVWLGYSSATNTPLHKDPNPNLFVQLAGRKRVRIFEPKAWGDVGRFREEEEMMVGERKEWVEGMVWGGGMEGFEVEVGPGDGVFIPKGWWHAVKGVGEGVGGSVNWWFR